MIKLCGFDVSNYYAKVKLAFLEKGIPYEAKSVIEDGALFALSPRGKIPFLIVDEGSISESDTICEYLEDVYPEPSLYPPGAFARAKCRELVQVIELYIELPARRLYPWVFFGGPEASEDLKKEVRVDLEKGLAAVARLVRPDPFLCGSALSYADLAAYVHLPNAARVSKRAFGDDLVYAVPGLRAHRDHMAARPSAIKLKEDSAANLPAFLEWRKRGGPPQPASPPTAR
jgi:glutathione S-transferase